MLLEHYFAEPFLSLIFLNLFFFFYLIINNKLFLFHYILLNSFFSNHWTFYVSYFGFNNTNITGFLLFTVFIFQFLTGFLLTFYYSCFLFISFDCVNFICIEVYWGFLIRVFHCIFASLFMGLIFIHFFRGVYLRLNVIDSFSPVWISGIFLLILSMIVSVLGYILQFGNLGFWALCVIKNLLGFISSIYFLGWFFIYDTRLLTLHFFLAFTLGILVVFHIGFLHNFSSINPTTYNIDFIYGFSLTLLKDLLFITFILIISFLFILFDPFIILLGNSSNLVFVDFLNTPTFIKPEWYFCSIFAILRSFSLKFVGILMVFLLLFLLFL